MTNLTNTKNANGKNNVEEQWFSLEDLAKVTGIATQTLKNRYLPSIFGNPDFSTANSKSVGKSHKKYYNIKVIEAIKAYQLSAHGNTKNADVANESTASMIQNATQMVSFKALMESGNIEAVKEYMNVCLAYTESVSKSKQLEQENNQLKHALEYDAIVGWKRWTDLKEEWKKDFEELKHRVSFGYLVEKAGLVAEEDYKEKVMGFDKFPTKMISPSGEDKLWNYFDR